MTVVVRLFARARDLAGTDRLTVELPTGAVVADLRLEVLATTPALAGLLPRCAVALAGEFVQDGQVLADGAEIALLPPVSGG